MNEILKYSGVVALVILAISGLLGSFSGNSLGSATACTDGYTCFTNLEVQGNHIVDGTSVYNGLVSALSGLKVGSSGTQVNKLISTTCDLLIRDTTILASTTKKFDCAVTGVTAGDRVVANFASTSPAILINGVSASSTAGFVTFSVTNVSGGTITTAGSNVGSSTQLIITN